MSDFEEPIEDPDYAEELQRFWSEQAKECEERQMGERAHLENNVKKFNDVDLGALMEMVENNKRLEAQLDNLTKEVASVKKKQQHNSRVNQEVYNEGCAVATEPGSYAFSSNFLSFSSKKN